MSYQERDFRIGSRFAGAMLSHLQSQKFIRSQQRDQRGALHRFYPPNRRIRGIRFEPQSAALCLWPLTP